MVKKAAQATPNRLLMTARKESGWTQQDVADRIDAPQSFNISRWEQGTTFPTTHYIQKLCLLFGKSARELGLLLEEPAVSSKPSTGAISARLWNVPYRRNPFFTGREDLLDVIHNKFTTEDTAFTHSLALCGLGGIGKTQIALEYVYRYREAYHAVLWVRAASRETLISDVMLLAGLFRLPMASEQDQNSVVDAVKRWLTHHKGWLLILDNLDDWELAAEFLPTGDNGQILLTTRSQVTGSIAPTIHVEKMRPEEGILLLLRRAQILTLDTPLKGACEEERKQSQAIVEAIDGLPLALDQAGAYIEETGCGLTGYLELYRTHHRDLLRRRSALRTDHPEPVASTWALSFLKIEQANPAAADLLRLCVFLDPDAIPEEIITDGHTELGPLLGTVSAHPLELNEVIQELRRYSLVTRDTEAKLLNIHRLVQVVLKDEMDEQMQSQWAERTVRAVNRVFPEVTLKDWQSCQKYLPHVLGCAGLIEQYHLTFPEAAHLLMRVGAYLRECATYSLANLLLQRALAIYEETLGPKHPDIAETLNHLALLYWYQGKYEQATPLLRRALMLSEQRAEPVHPITAETLNHLGLLFYYQGKYRQAELHYQRALMIFEQTLGPKHPYTVSTVVNLALLYKYQGNYHQAEPLLQHALTINEQTLGSEHPQTTNILHHLASLYALQGCYIKAEPLLQRALVLSEQTLGPEYPDTSGTLINLSTLYSSRGLFEKTAPAYQLTIKEESNVFGPSDLREIQWLFSTFKKNANAREHSLKVSHIYTRQLALEAENLH